MLENGMSVAFPFRPLAHGAIALAVLAIPDARAAEWKITPRIEAREAFTDNARLSRGSKTSDFVTRVAPGIDLKAQGGRVLADVDYSLAYDAYARLGYARAARLTGLSPDVVQRALPIDPNRSLPKDPPSAPLLARAGAVEVRT